MMFVSRALFWLVLFTTFVPRPRLYGQGLEGLKKFDELTGKWRATFRVFTLEGELQTEIDVTQHYFWRSDTQFVDIVDRYRTGKT